MYDARISKLRDSLGKTNCLLSPTAKSQSPSTELESPLSHILENIENDPKTEQFLLDQAIDPELELKLAEER